MSIDITFLRDMEHGGSSDQPAHIVSQLAEFVSGAQTSLHLAVYDFRLDPSKPPYSILTDAFRQRAAAGVDIRIAFDQGKTRAGRLSSPAPAGTDAFLAQAFAGTGIQICPVTDRNPMHIEPRLMHSKYLIRDGATPNAAVWTGSVNLTDDAWTYEENNIVQIVSPELARYYETDFSEMWASGDIDSSGRDDLGTVTIGSSTVDVAFSPGEGITIDERAEALIAGAKKRIKLASMLLASRAVLHALQNSIRNSQVSEFKGVYDLTQMQETIQNWKEVPKNNDLIPLFGEVSAQLAGKVSDPYTPTSKHNFLHDKVLICDDTVLTGSFNLSHSATMNAENVLVIHDSQLADLYSAYVDTLVLEYGKS